MGKVDLDKEVQQRNEQVYVPNWFTVDLKTGMLCIHLVQDEVDCFSAWVSAKELDTTNNADAATADKKSTSCRI